MVKRAQWKQTAKGRVEKSKSISAASCRRSQNSHKFRAFLTRSRPANGKCKEQADKKYRKKTKEVSAE